MTRLVVVTSLNRMVPLLGAEMPNATVHRRFAEFAQQAGTVPVFADAARREEIEDPDRPILGVQWHPELVARPAGDVHAVLFRWLCDA